MKKVLLIVPPTGKWMREDRCESPPNSTIWSVNRPPTRLAQAAAILITASYECKIIDCPSENKGWKDLKKELQAFNPDILFVSTVKKTIEKDIYACLMAKSYNNSVLTILKGSPFSKEIETLEKYKELDIFLTREIDWSLLSVLSRDNLNKINGIAYKENNNIIKTPPAGFENKLDTLPFLARGLLKNELYLRPDTMEPFAIILTTKGCPFRCTFCPVHINTGNKFITRSPKLIVDEIEECEKKFGITNVLMGSEVFSLDKKWTFEVCNEIINRGLKVKWSCSSRVDLLNYEIACKMEEAGCFAINLGIESGNQESLDKTNKCFNLAQAVEAVKILKKTKIRTYLYYMIGFPWETRGMIKKTIDFALKLDGDISDFYLATPLPETKFFTDAKENNLLLKNTDKSSYDYRFNNPHLTYQEIRKLQRYAFWKFYMRPNYIFRTAISIRSPRIIFRLFKMVLKNLYSILLFQH